VMANEESTKSVNATVKVVQEAGEIIGRLNEVIAEAALLASESSAVRVSSCSRW